MSEYLPETPHDDEAALSAAQRAYLCLRERIVTLSSAPGERVVEHEIADELGISRTPVHEAVQKLAMEGLVEIVPRVGTFVARIPLGGLEEAMMIRSALELAIVDRSTREFTPEEGARLQAILDAQKAFLLAGDKRGFHQSDEDFHAAIADLCGLPGVWQAVLKAKMQIDRYRQLTLSVQGRMDNVLAQHYKIAESIASGNPDGAVAAMSEHLGHVLPLLEVTRKMHPEYFMEASKP